MKVELEQLESTSKLPRRRHSPGAPYSKRTIKLHKAPRLSQNRKADLSETNQHGFRSNCLLDSPHLTCPDILKLAPRLSTSIAALKACLPAIVLLKDVDQGPDPDRERDRARYRARLQSLPDQGARGGKRGHPTSSTASYLWRQANGGREDSSRLST